MSLVSIKFTSDSSIKIINYLLTNAVNYVTNSSDLLSDCFTHDKDNGKYILNLKLNHGKHKLLYKDTEIQVIYTNSNCIVGITNKATTYETLVLSSISKDIILEYVEESRKISVTPDKNDKLLCRILKQNGGWGLLSKINKRPSKTLFMDIDLTELLNNIQTFFDSETDYVEHGVPFKMNFLFHGVPGTGKTSLIYTIASHFDLDICFLNITKDLDDNSFTMAITNLPDDCILVLEDIDALFIERESKSGVSFSTVLNVLDGMIRKHKLLTFLTTNYKDRLDSALKRSGRIDYELEFSYATQKQTENMFKYFFTKDLDKFLKFTRKLKYTTSDLHKFLFKNRKTDDIMEHIEELSEIINNNNSSDKLIDNLYM